MALYKGKGNSPGASSTPKRGGSTSTPKRGGSNSTPKRGGSNSTPKSQVSTPRGVRTPRGVGTPATGTPRALRHREGLDLSLTYSVVWRYSPALPSSPTSGCTRRCKVAYYKEKVHQLRMKGDQQVRQLTGTRRQLRSALERAVGAELKISAGVNALQEGLEEEVDLMGRLLNAIHLLNE